MYVIEKNVQLKETRGARKGTSQYPIKDMKVGDSFLVKDKDPKSVRNAVHQEAHRRKIHVAVRTTEEGVRVWRMRKPRTMKQ